MAYKSSYNHALINMQNIYVVDGWSILYIFNIVMEQNNQDNNNGTMLYSLNDNNTANNDNSTFGNKRRISLITQNNASHCFVLLAYLRLSLAISRCDIYTGRLY
ncbi:putative orfan [Tupanvirus soda lake]|uniref:Orfan n=2 Tax=Tupanvirus TaxID=2094720 RepID=A0AC62AAW4_9VIRU|nr:putative orfan [Tupanvirus soda lake]QKU34886.1 putative orfan [Tupanvirus soda lake]